MRSYDLLIRYKRINTFFYDVLYRIYNFDDLKINIYSFICYLKTSNVALRFVFFFVFEKINSFLSSQELN